MRGSLHYGNGAEGAEDLPDSWIISDILAHGDSSWLFDFFWEYFVECVILLISGGIMHISIKIEK